MIWPVLIISLLVCNLLDALYCGLETGIYVTNKIRLELWAAEGRRTARILQDLLRRPGNLLAVLLIGTNVARFGATFCIAAMFTLAGLGDRAEWYTLAAATPLLFVVGDAVPKNVFRRLGERAVYRLAGFLRISDLVFRTTGLSLVVRGLSAALLRLARKPAGYRHTGVEAVVDEGRASGALTHFQSAMVDRVLNLADVTLGDVMMPLGRAVTAPAEIGRDDLLERIRKHNYSRLPLLDGDGQVVGVLDVYDVLTRPGLDRPADAAVAPVILGRDTTITDALYRLRQQRRRLAIVADADGRHVGLVTVKDLVEEIVGELEAW